jgi:hypothetical protein
MLHLWLGSERLITQSCNSGKPSGIFLLWVTLASGETLPTRNLPSEALRPKCCLYEMPYYVAAPVRETGDVITQLQEPEFFFWFTSISFLRRPVSIQYWLLRPFFWGSHTQEQYHQWTTLCTWNPNSRLKMWRPLGLTLRCMPYGRGTLRIPLRRFS